MSREDSLYRIFVDNLSGKLLTTYVKQSYTIERLIRLIACYDAKVFCWRLFCKGREMIRDKKISDYRIEADEIIYLIEMADPQMENPFRIRLKIKLPNENTFTLDVNSFDTIEHLKLLIYEKVETENNNNNLNDMNLTYYAGTQLEDDKTLSEQHISSDDVILISSKNSSDETVLRIFIKTLTGVVYRLFVYASYTVEHLKLLVFYKSGLPPDQQRLVYAGKQFEDEPTLEKYGVLNASYIHLITRLRGGGLSLKAFVFSEVSYFETRRSSSTDPSYRQFCNGVNSEGVCNNPKCSVYGEKFVCRHGYGVYRMYEHHTKCPECQVTSLRVESFGFSRANVIVRAMPLGLKGQQAEIRNDLLEADGDYKCLPYFVINSLENREYEFIEVLSCAPDCSITLGEEFCLVCDRTLVGSIVCDHGLSDVWSYLTL